MPAENTQRSELKALKSRWWDGTTPACRSTYGMSPRGSGAHQGPIALLKIKKEINSHQDEHPTARLSDLTCSFCPEQVVRESRNHIKVFGERVAGRCRCGPANSSAPCCRCWGCALPVRGQPARTSGSSRRGHGKVRESRQAVFLPAFLLPCSASCGTLGRCGAITFLGRATRCEHSHSSSFLISFHVHTLQLLTSSATESEGLQLKSEWRERIQLPLLATEISVWKCWRKAPETHFHSQCNSNFLPRAPLQRCSQQLPLISVPRLEHCSTTGLLLSD